MEKCEILVVEDETEIAELLREVLVEDHWSVRCVARSEDARAVIESSAPPLLMLDIHLPGATGLELLAWVRGRGYPCAAVVVTADCSSERIVEAMQLGAADFVAKPFDLQEIRDRAPIWVELGKRLQKALGSDPGRQPLQAQVRTIEQFRAKLASISRPGAAD